MLNKLWLSFFVVAFIAALWQWLGLGNVDIFRLIVEAIFAMAKLSIEIALGLVGLLCFWMGLLKIAEQSGLAADLAKLLSPLFTRLMPGVPKNHPAFGHITMNFAANMLGLDNAATPVGIKAMQSLQELNADKETATNAQILFLVLNSSSITLFPVTILMYRAQQGAADAAEVFIPILLATTASSLCGLLAVAWVQRINLLDRVVLSYLAAIVAIVGGLVGIFSQLEPEQMGTVSSALGNGLLLTTILYFLVVAHFRKVAVYDSFITGAKQGFELAVQIMPYLVAMLVGVGVLRASGALDVFLQGIGYLVSSIGLPTDFIDALPTAIMKPFSGSGARAMMLETMNTQGVDSFAGRLAAIFQGSTETTFYVVAVYFGAVGVRNVRHAIGCGLLADLAGILTAIWVAYWFFG